MSTTVCAPGYISAALSAVLLWLLILTNATDDMIAMMMTSATPSPNQARGNLRRETGEAATEFPDGICREPRPGLVTLGSRCWVVASTIGSCKVRVGSSEVITALPPVTVAPHLRQKFAPGRSSALQEIHLGMLIIDNITAAICFGQANGSSVRVVSWIVCF